jgi:MSHA biogenesis protein MshJ
MLAPDRAAGILEQVLDQEAGLTLQSVTARSEPLTAADTGSREGAPPAGIGRYALELQLEGSYLATLRYLRALEALPWKFFWQGVAFEVIEYPRARITLDLYTLGLLEG